MGDMNIGTKTITGLNPYQEIVCEVLDVSQKITVNGKTPLTQKFLAYSPSTDRTTYESIDIATDIDINSLTSLTSPDVNNDEMII